MGERDATPTGLVVCHEIWGVTPALQRKAGERARRGFRVAVPSFYAAVGRPPVIHDEQAAYEARGLLHASSIEGTLAGAIEGVRTRTDERVAVVGYSMGGTIALWAATLNLPISHAVTFYGGGLAVSPWRSVPCGLDLIERLVLPWLGLYGGRDPLTPPSEVDQALQLCATTSLGQIRRYEEADHAWALDHSNPRYSSSITARSEHETVSFFNLVG